MNTAGGKSFLQSGPNRAVAGAALGYITVAIIFGAFAFASVELTRAESRIAAVWLPNAFAVAFLMRAKLAREDLLIVALWATNTIANTIGGDPVSTAAALAACNALEIQLAVYLARRWAGPTPDMLDIKQLTGFLAAAALVAPTISASFATLILSVGSGDWLGIWAKWAITDGLGMALAAPAIMIFADAWPNRHTLSSSKTAEWLALTVIGTLATIAVFAQNSFPLLFLIAPIVIAHAFRLGGVGTAFSITKIAVVATIFTALGYGPINLLDRSPTADLIVLQVFLASCLLIGLPVAAMLKGRERMIADLDAGRRELALLANNITDAILVYDLEGRCTYASPSVSDVLDAPPSDFMGTRTGTRSHRDARDQIAQAERRLLSGESEKERFTYRRANDDANGAPVYIEAECALASDPLTGVPSGIIVSARDVTERVNLELQLTRARRHAENAARAKSEFLANMSHEIRTPMNGVLGFAELLQQDTELSRSQRKHADLIVQSGRSMMMLLNDILDLSKIEAGQIVIDHRPVDLDALVEECADLHRASAENKDIQLVVRGERNPPHIVTDGLRLRQIILNLIGNAIKFTESGSVVVSYKTDNDQFSVSIKDTGIGISTDRLNRIFRPFEQGESDTARRFGGTGLGLSISRQLAELLGGFLEAKSEAGIGSRFVVTLPLVRAMQAPQRDHRDNVDHEGALAPGSRILLAEDHDVNRLLVTAMLERCGQSVWIARDGNEAVAAVLDAFSRSKPFDLVLMDIQMPGCDGYSASRSIRAEGIPASKLPIIALTANAFPEDIAAARDAGMQGHLAKPLAFADLVGALQRWLPTRIVDLGQQGRSGEDVTRGSASTEEATLPANPTVISSPELQERWQVRRREAIDAVGDALRDGRLVGRDGEELARLVHKLAGTAGMFGEESLGQHAAEFERALRSENDMEVRRELAIKLLAVADKDRPTG